MGRAKDVLVAGLVLLVRRRRRKLRAGERERVVPPAPENAVAELAAVLLLLAGTANAVAFVVVYVLDWLAGPPPPFGAVARPRVPVHRGGLHRHRAQARGDGGARGRLPRERASRGAGAGRPDRG